MTKKKDVEMCIAICQNTGKLILMYFDKVDDEWICLHKETREKEIKEINKFIKKYE